MSDERSLLVGFDLSNDYSQICCYDQNMSEIKPISASFDNFKYLIPSVLGVKNSTKDWVLGEEALILYESGNGVLVEELIGKVRRGEETEIFGVSFDGVTLLEKFIRKCLQHLKGQYPNNSILRLVITVKELDEVVKEGIYKALLKLGIDKDRALVQDHLDSYQHYALSQSKELWINDVGLFDFDEKGLVYRQIKINRKNRPFLINLEETDFSEILNPAIMDEIKEKEKLGYTFRNLAKNILYKQVVTTLYFTGTGFEDNWADMVIKELCAGRRVFKGQNLYSKGACYKAMELAGKNDFKDFLFFKRDMITSYFSVFAYYGTKAAEVFLAKPGTCWYEAEEKIDFILDDEKEISIYRQNVLNQERTTYTISLEGLPNRPGKTTRVQVRFKFINKETAVVTVKDEGFGEFYPSTGRIWEIEIS